MIEKRDIVERFKGCARATRNHNEHACPIAGCAECYPLEAADDFDEAAAEIQRLRADARYLLHFVPPWAREVPDGLDPTFYGTGTAEGDRKVMARVQAIEAALATHGPRQGESNDG